MTEQHLQSLKEKGLIREYKASVGKDVGGKGENDSKEARKPSKYRNNKFVDSDGVRWDSKKEYCRYQDLKFLQSIGEITYLERQVVFVLSVCKYVADACYYDKTGKYIVEDTKSAHTRKLPVYRLKKKLMQKERNIIIKEF